MNVGIIEAGELVLDMPEINIPGTHSVFPTYGPHVMISSAGMVGKSLGTDVDWKVISCMRLRARVSYTVHV